MPERHRPFDPSGSLESTERFLRGLGAIDEHMSRIVKPMHGEVQAIFERLAGDFGSFEASVQVTRRVQRLLDRLQLGLECQHPGCGRPARLRCRSHPLKPPWRFAFGHLIGRKESIHGSWPRMPPLKLVPDPGQGQRDLQDCSSEASGLLDNPVHALETLIEIEEQMDRLLEPVRVEIQQTLDRLAGKRFGTLDANRRVLRRMQHLLGRLRLEFACDVPGCERPGRLRCNPQRTGPQPWVFTIEHYSPGGKACWHLIGSKDRPGRFPSLQLVRLADEDDRRPNLSTGEE